jgi:hypothetical protein
MPEPHDPIGPTRRFIARVALLLLAGAALYQGVWAQLAPRSFYEQFPNGMSWVVGEGPYNEHLVRDIGGLVNGMAVVALVAAVTLSRPLLVTTAIAWLTYALPHLAFHVAHPLDEPGQQAVNVVVLCSEVLLPVVGLLGVGARNRGLRAADYEAQGPQPATAAHPKGAHR